MVVPANHSGLASHLGHGPEFTIAIFDQFFGGERLEFGQVATDRRTKSLSHCLVVVVSTTYRFMDNLVNDAEMDDILCGRLERFGGEGPFTTNPAELYTS